MGVEVRGGAVTVPTVAGFILSALESSGERATLRSHQCVDSACGERHAERGERAVGGGGAGGLLWSGCLTLNRIQYQPRQSDLIASV